MRNACLNLSRVRRQTAAAAATFIAVLATALVAPAQQPEEKFQRTFKVNAGSTLRVENYKGTIHVTGSDTNRVLVNGFKRFEGSESNRRGCLENTKINFATTTTPLPSTLKFPHMHASFT